MEVAALPLLERAHTHHERYLEDGKVTDELLESCIHLAIIVNEPAIATAQKKA